MSSSHDSDTSSSPTTPQSQYLGNTHCFNNDTVWNVNFGVTDERAEILTWLSPLEPRNRHQDIRNRRADNVGEWLMQTDEFQSWCDSIQEEGFRPATLFCYGDPAVGKTYFSSLVVDKLCEKAEGEDIAVACFYVDFGAREEQTPINMLGSILKQIVAGLETIPKEIRKIFQKHKKVIGGRGLLMPELVKMLQIVASLRPTFICVDALDECTEGHRSEVLNALRQILEESENTQIFLTGRRHIKSEVERRLDSRAAILLIKPSNDDIVGYIRMRLSKERCRDVTDDDLEAEIIKSIAKNTPETFLLISLTMDAILGETTAYGRRQKLKEIPQGLDLKDVYGATLQRIKEQGGEKSRLGMRALMWISHSERLLQLDELFHALAIEIGSTELNSKRIPSVETLLGCCLGLVVVDRKAMTARLIHYTLQEYLSTCPNIFGATHSIMAETCLTYLNFQTIKEIPPTLFALPRSTPFLKYSSLYWGAHARRNPSEEVVSLALELFSRIESHISTKLLLVDLISRTGRYYRDIPANGPLIGFTGLHCASIFGIAEIATLFMDQLNPDPNERDFLGITPLLWAAICGQEGVVKLLLKRQNVKLDKRDGYFRRTALSWAARKGHKGVVKLLLGRTTSKMNMVRRKSYVNPNSPDKYGQTPIFLAAEEGHEEVVEVLLGRKDVKPDTVDGYGRTPLLSASSKGREGVVKLLLEQCDVGTDRPDKNGETPLLSAAEDGSEAVVRLLLRREDINPNRSGKEGQTPLSLASKKGHNEVVKLLLEREDINPNIPDDYSQTPLTWAAQNGHEGVVRLLLERKDVDPNISSISGSTPLSWAAKNGNDGVVKLLLERNDVDLDMASASDTTPLAWAAQNGNDGVVKLLVGQAGVNHNMRNNYGQTPLVLAAKNGRDGVVKLLLGWKDVDLNMSDNDDQTSLTWASKNGHDGVVKLLLQQKDVNRDTPSISGTTPLAWAARNGNDGVVRLLLKDEDVNYNMPNNYGQTPLWLAAENGRDGVVKLLLEQKDVNPNMPDKDDQTPLTLAAVYGRDRVVELLLGHEDVVPDIQDKHGQTPLAWAARNGHDGVVSLLLKREDVDPDMPSTCGTTPLSWAAQNGHERVVKLLVKHEDVDPDMPSVSGSTPLSWAAANGHEGVVKLLLERKDVNPDTKNMYGHTPLWRASKNGHDGVVKLLQPANLQTPTDLTPTTQTPFHNPQNPPSAAFSPFS